MPEHQQIQHSKKPDTIFQKQAIPTKQIPLSNTMAIIQRAKINPKSLTHADVMQLQRTIGNRAVGKLLSEIGLIPSTAKPVQRQEILEGEETCPSCVQRQEIPEEEEPLQGKMIETIQRQEMPEEEEPLQGKMIEPIQQQEIPEEEEPLQGKMIKTIQRQEIPEEEEPLQGKLTEPIQRQEIPEEEEPLQGKMIGTIQRQESPEEEETLQGKMIETVQRQEIPEEEEPLQTKRENNTGMPDNLKAGVENLSGIDMSDVKVHYNSDKPAEVGALAYTQGTDIHVAPGQEKHLSHEVWHVVQQAQGRVKPTMQLKGVSVNDDEKLENEADEMGQRSVFQSNSLNSNQYKQNNSYKHITEYLGDNDKINYSSSYGSVFQMMRIQDLKPEECKEYTKLALEYADLRMALGLTGKKHKPLEILEGSDDFRIFRAKIKFFIEVCRTLQIIKKLETIIKGEKYGSIHKELLKEMKELYQLEKEYICIFNLDGASQTTPHEAPPTGPQKITPEHSEEVLAPQSTLEATTETAETLESLQNQCPATYKDKKNIKEINTVIGDLFSLAKSFEQSKKETMYSRIRKATDLASLIKIQSEYLPGSLKIQLSFEGVAGQRKKVKIEQIQKNKKLLDHIFIGDYDRDKKPTGYHSTFKKEEAIHEGFGEKFEHVKGFYKRKVREKKKKSNEKKEPSSFFPDNADEFKIIAAIALASFRGNNLYEINEYPEDWIGIVIYKIGEDTAFPYF